MRTGYRTCPFCEATCGLEITLDGDEVVTVRGDAEDVFSRGFLCPKGVAIKALHEDPDRLRTPLVDGRPATWDEAFEVVAERLPPVIEAHGRDAVATYLGNPSAHGLSALLYGRVLVKALGSKNVFTASTVDQRPKELSSALMFGHQASIPVPDVDRTDFLLMLGANPMASNGSLLTAPDMRGRLRALRQRGGRFVVVDPRRTRTAEEADTHLAIYPGTDAHLLMGLVHVLGEEGRVHLGALAEHVVGFEDALLAAEPFSPEVVAPVCGIEADVIRQLARDLAAAPRAAVYGRIGTTTQRFGTLTSWLVDVLNVLTGNLDREGGAMFTLAAAGQTNSRGAGGVGRGAGVGRWASRVRGLPESFGEIPVAALAEEIDTPGEGQIRALITIAGNPARSTPNSARLEQGLAGLDFMLSLDIYRNETTRHADVVLPAPSPLEKSHYDLALYQFACRNVANYSPALLDSEVPDEWRTLLRLVGVVTGQGPSCDVEALDDFVAGEVASREGVELSSCTDRVGPERLLDLMLRGGPYDLTLADLEAAPHGIDLGPLTSRLPGVLRTPSGKIELAPEPLIADVARLRASLEEVRNGHMVLVGRRHLRSNNSWMHNLPILVKGPARCTLQVHPDDASRLSLVDGETACVTSAAGEIEAVVEVTDTVRAGVVSLPHGWGHDAEGATMRVAAGHAGVNSNLLTDETLIDPLSGNAVLNGIPVTVAPARVPVLS
jgi:anaerobic selenocysteine-containing dehydrogenase